MAQWQNWGRSATAEPREVISPTTPDQVRDIVHRAAGGRRRVKAIGAGHSFTEIAVANDIQLDMSRLRGVLEVDRESGHVRLAAGTRLHQIPAILDPLGLAMTNLGDIDRQSLSGATSTGTHGTGLRYGGLATQIVALRLVTGNGDLLTINAAENAHLLSAAALGLGALGIVVDITLRCVPAFSLAAQEKLERVEDVAARWDEDIHAHDHYEFYWFPHTRNAVTKTNTRGPAREGEPRKRPGPMKRLEGVAAQAAFRGMCTLATAVPGAAPSVSKIVSRTFSDGNYTDRSDRVFVAEREVKFREMEYGVDLDAVPTIQRELQQMIARRDLRITFPVEFRASAADDLLMSSAHGRDTAYVAVHRFWRENPTEFFAEAERIFLDHGGRPHWGKMHTLTADQLRERLPRFDDFLAIREQLDPHRVFTNPYLDRVLGR